MQPVVLTRVDTFSIILIIDRSRAPGSLQPLGFFLFTVERTDISYISSSLDLSKTLSLRCLTKAVLSFRGGNNDRNGIYSSPKEIISNAILFVNLFNGAVAKNARANHTRWHKMC